MRQIHASSGGAALAHCGSEGVLHRVPCAIRVAYDARRDAREDVEAAAVQRLQLLQARSAASSHTSLTWRMRVFF
jgi:hypothetical protein